MRVARALGVSLCLALLAATVAAAPAAALEPPHPGDAGESVRGAWAPAGDRFAPELVRSAVERLTVATLGLAPVCVPPPAWHGMPSKGVVEVPALLISFSDYPPAAPASAYESMLFGDGDAANEPTESLHDYYYRSSYGQLDIQGTVLGWYDTGQPRSAVPQTAAGREALIMQALQSYDATTDFSRFDNDGDGRIDYLIIIWAGPLGAPRSFWSAGFGSWYVNPGFRLDGTALRVTSWQSEQPSPLVIIHETGHALGLPDLYDYDASVGPGGGVGGLDTMDFTWGDLNGFSKWVLDWLTPQVCSGTPGTYTLAPSATSPDVLLVMPGAPAGDPFGEYFLVQNRSRVGNDVKIPTDGLLIWHVDARLNDLGNNYAWDNSYTAHKLLRLMEADGLEEIEQHLGADAGDFYRPGASFGPDTTPGSSAYSGATTDVRVGDISWAGTSLTFSAGAVAVPASTSTYGFAADASSGWHDAAQTVRITASGGSGTGRTIHYSTDGGATWSARAAAAVDVPVGDEGSHHVLFYASDTQATEDTHDAGWVNVDLTPPVTTDDSAGRELHTPATITLTPHDALSGMTGGAATTEHRADGATAWTTGTAVVLTEGAHTLVYRSTDNAGNVETPDKVVSVTVGPPAPPESSSPYAFAAGARSGWHNTAQSVPITMSGGTGSGQTVHYSLDGRATWSAAPGPAVTVTVAAPGAHHVVYYASDSRFTEDPHDAGWVNIDTGVPAASVQKATTRSGRNVTLRFRISDPRPGCGVATVVFRIQKGGRTLQTVSTAPCPTNAVQVWTFRVKVRPGTYVCLVTATDAAGNATAKAAAARLVVRR